MLQVECKFGLVLSTIQLLLVLERNSNIVEESIARPCKRLQRTTNNANVVQKEERVVLVPNISTFRSGPATPIIHSVTTVQHF
jgi:hypothetical protein